MKTSINFTLFLAVTILSGCATTETGFSIIAGPRDVTATEAVNFIKSSKDLSESRSEAEMALAVGEEGTSNHPSLVLSEGVASELPSMTVRRGESLLFVAERLKKLANYTRLIFDFSPGTVTPGSARSENNSITIGSETLTGEVAALYDKQIPGIAFYAANDSEGTALVVSNRGYERWKQLSIFDVKVGTLQDNAARLAGAIGWTLDLKSNWINADDFSIGSGFPLVTVVNDPRQAFTALFKPYPLQAQLNPNTAAVSVVSRVQPNYQD